MLRTDRRIVLRTWFRSFAWNKMRLLSRWFNKDFIYCSRIWEIENNLSKTIWMWHPPFLKNNTQIKGGPDATSEAYAYLG